MTRPSQNLDRKLVSAALAMLPETGFSGLRIREVARRANVNPGMFHYYFKSKEAFQRRVLQEIYDDFFKTFSEAAEGSGEPRARLRRVLVAFAHFARDNRVPYTLMMRELLNAQPDMFAFAQENFPRHVSVLIGLMEECLRAKAVRPLPVSALCMFAMGSMALPNVAVTTMERNGMKRIVGKSLKEFSDELLSDEMIEIRADMALAGLSPAGRL